MTEERGVQMRDKNGIEIVTGNIVKVSNAYFKSDNGLYFVEHSPGDPSWCGSDHCLKRICRNGKLSTSKYNICFWPVRSYCNDRMKRALSDEWNDNHAEIEVVSVPNTGEIAKHFREEAESADYWAKREAWNWGEDNPSAVKNREIRDFYAGVAARLEVA